MFGLAGDGNEAGAERVVAGGEGVDGAFEGGGVEGAADADGGDDVIGGVARGIELGEEPEAGLGGGEGRGVVAAGALGDRGGGGGAGVARGEEGDEGGFVGF